MAMVGLFCGDGGGILGCGDGRGLFFCACVLLVVFNLCIW